MAVNLSEYEKQRLVSDCAFYKGKCLAYEAVLRAAGMIEDPKLIKLDDIVGEKK